MWVIVGRVAKEKFYQPTKWMWIEFMQQQQQSLKSQYLENSLIKEKYFHTQQIYASNGRYYHFSTLSPRPFQVPSRIKIYRLKGIHNIQRNQRKIG